MNNVMIKDIPDEEKPRERMIKYGVENISNEDLLAIIIKSGTKDLSSKSVASQILKELKNISELKNLSISKLSKIKGIGPVKAIELLAAIELGRRVYYEQKLENKTKLNNPINIYNFFKYKLENKLQEHFYCLYLDNQKNLIDYKLLFIGTLNISIVHPREIFKNACLLSASSIICLHNHPSGGSNPSPEDKKMTMSLKEAGKLIGIELLDHIIISDSGYYSFFENQDI